MLTTSAKNILKHVSLLEGHAKRNKVVNSRIDLLQQ
jgi:hypothetical protein